MENTDNKTNIKPDVTMMEAALETAANAIDEVTELMWRGEGGKIATSLNKDEIEQAYYALCEAIVPIDAALAYKRSGATSNAIASQQNAGFNETLRDFEKALTRASWQYESSDDSDVRKNGYASIEKVSSLFASLDLSDRAAGEALMQAHVPAEWKDSWEKVLKNAFDRQSRIAAERAEKIGVLSSDPGAANYKANYGYVHTQDGVDFFRHRQSRALIGSPVMDRRDASAHSKRGLIPTL